MLFKQSVEDITSPLQTSNNRHRQTINRQFWADLCKCLPKKSIPILFFELWLNTRSSTPAKKHVRINLPDKLLAKKVFLFLLWPWQYENTLQWYNYPLHLHCVYCIIQIDRKSLFNGQIHQLERKQIKNKSRLRKEMTNNNKKICIDSKEGLNMVRL